MGAPIAPQMGMAPGMPPAGGAVGAAATGAPNPIQQIAQEGVQHLQGLVRLAQVLRGMNPQAAQMFAQGLQQIKGAIDLVRGGAGGAAPGPSAAPGAVPPPAPRGPMTPEAT